MQQPRARGTMRSASCISAMCSYKRGYCTAGELHWRHTLPKSTPQTKTMNANASAQAAESDFASIHDDTIQQNACSLQYCRPDYTLCTIQHTHHPTTATHPLWSRYTLIYFYKTQSNERNSIIPPGSQNSCAHSEQWASTTLGICCAILSFIVELPLTKLNAYMKEAAFSHASTADGMPC